LKQRALGLFFVLLVLPAAAAADGYVDAGDGVYRCAQGTAKVTGGTARVAACSYLGAAPYAGIQMNESPFFFVRAPDPVLVFASVVTSKGADWRWYSFNPSSPDPAALSVFTMDPAMSSARVVATMGTISVDVTLTGLGDPLPFVRSGITQGIGTDLDACASGGASVGLARAGTMSGSIRSSRLGGGAVSKTTVEMTQSTGAGANIGFVARAGWFVMC
jgi:hypothetical protein